MLTYFNIRYSTDRFGPLDIVIGAVDRKEALSIVREEPYFTGVISIEEDLTNVTARTD